MSHESYKALEFNNAKNLGAEQKLAFSECMEKVLHLFINDIGFKKISPLRDSQLRGDVRAWAEAHLPKKPGCKEIDHILEGAVSIVEHFFPVSNHDSRFQMAIAVSVALQAEMAKELGLQEDVLTFLSNLLCQNHLGGWQQAWSTAIKGFVDHFGSTDPRIGTLGAISLGQFIESIYTEEIYSHKLPPHLSYAPFSEGVNSSDGFAYLFRIFTGVPGPFIACIMKPSRDEEVPYDYWMTSVVNLTTFMNLTKRLTSWPKEALSGETQNYICIQTHTRRQANQPSHFYSSSRNCGWTYRDTVYETIKMVQASSKSLDMAFVDFAK